MLFDLSLTIILCLMFILLFASPALCFEKKAHRGISKSAVRIYESLYPAEAAEKKELMTSFIEGSVLEDNFLDPSLQRILNWHFYDPGNRLGRTWWGATRSNTARFEKLTVLMKNEDRKKSAEFYELAGRLVHHIQDMSSPPHSVPIYHTAWDPFDKYATDTIPGIVLTAEQIESARNDQGALTPENLKTMLKDAAERTIGRVEHSVEDHGTIVAADWTLFWRKYELTGCECGEKPHEGFGCYGKLSFGTVTGGFSTSVYDRFYNEQVAFAIYDTLRLLILIGKR